MGDQTSTTTAPFLTSTSINPVNRTVGSTAHDLGHGVTSSRERIGHPWIRLFQRRGGIFSATIGECSIRIPCIPSPDFGLLVEYEIDIFIFCEVLPLLAKKTRWRVEVWAGRTESTKRCVAPCHVSFYSNFMYLFA